MQSSGGGGGGGGMSGAPSLPATSTSSSSASTASAPQLAAQGLLFRPRSPGPRITKPLGGGGLGMGGGGAGGPGGSGIGPGGSAMGAPPPSAGRDFHGHPPPRGASQLPPPSMPYHSYAYGAGYHRPSYRPGSDGPSPSASSPDNPSPGTEHVAGGGYYGGGGGAGPSGSRPFNPPPFSQYPGPPSYEHLQSHYRASSSQSTPSTTGGPGDNHHPGAPGGGLHPPYPLPPSHDGYGVHPRHTGGSSSGPSPVGPSSADSTPFSMRRSQDMGPHEYAARQREDSYSYQMPFQRNDDDDRDRARSPQRGSNSGATGGDAKASQKTVAPGDRKISCLECRSSKVKCSGQEEGSSSCARCKRIGRECVFEQHKRGRKPDSAKFHQLEKSVDVIMNVLEQFKKAGMGNLGKERGGEGEDEDGAGGWAGRKGRGDDEDEDEDAYDDDEDDDDHREDRRPSKRAKKNSGSSNDAFGEGSGSTGPSPRDHPSAGRQDRDRPRGKPELPTLDRLRSTDSAASSGAIVESPVQEDLHSLGLPPLSNPLKLLAQASGSADAARIAETPKPDASAPDDDEDCAETQGRPRRPTGGLSAAAALALQAGGKGAKQAGKAGAATAASARREGVDTAAGAKRNYWSLEIYSPRRDIDEGMDPISLGVVRLDTAQELFSFFLRHLNATISLLDAQLHTFDYVRSHSALLLSATCALAARFAKGVREAATIAKELDEHIKSKLLPMILLDGYRSAEIAQAFIILAAYHAPTKTLAGDRSWSLLGYGIRIAAELDMNARIVSNLKEESARRAASLVEGASGPNTPSTAATSSSASVLGSEMVQRKMRNRERTWMNLWLFEQSLATHMGRRPTLGSDPVTNGSAAGWHLSRLATPHDREMVSVIQLRKIMARGIDFFESCVSSSGLDHQQQQRDDFGRLALHIDFFRRNCGAELDAWNAAWADTQAATPGAWTSSMHLAYARLLLNSYPLKCSHLGHEILAPIYAESYSSALAFLGVFLGSKGQGLLTYGHNSTIVTVCYVAIFSLRLLALDARRYTFLDAGVIFGTVERLSEALAEAGKVTEWREACSASYAPFIASVLERTRRAYRNRQNGGGGEKGLAAQLGAANEGESERGTSSSTGGGSGSTTTSKRPSGSSGGTASTTPPDSWPLSNSDSNSNKPGQQQQQQTGASSLPPHHSSSASSGPSGRSLSIAFQAGPSGVMSTPAPVPMTDDGASLLDDSEGLARFLDTSVFSSMSLASGWDAVVVQGMDPEIQLGL